MPRVDNEMFLERMKRLHPRIKVNSKYRAAIIPVKCECLDCTYEWEARPANLTFKGSPTGCPQCGGTLKKTHSIFVAEMQELHPELEVLGTYASAHTPILVKCKIHNTEFKSPPTNLLRRATTGCKACLDTGTDSRIAYELKQYCLEKHPGTIVEYQVIKNPVTGRYLPFDIYIPDINGEPVFCEIMGQQHYGYKEYCHGDVDNYWRQVVRDEYKRAYAVGRGRYVEVDLRRIYKLEDAIELVEVDKRGWIAKKAASLKTDWLPSSRFLESVYENTDNVSSNGMKNVVAASKKMKAKNSK